MPNDLPLIILPGTLCDERAYAPQKAAFPEREIIFADLSRDSSIAAMANRILANAPDRFLVFGHSMGGMAALELLRQAPERVAGAIMMSTNPMPETDERKVGRLALLAELDTKPLGEIMKERLVPNYFRGNRPDLAALAIDMAVTMGGDAFRSQAQALIDRPDSRGTLPDISAPVLLIGGRHDNLVPPDQVREMSKTIPGAACEIIEDSAHFAGLENTAEVNACIGSWFEMLQL